MKRLSKKLLTLVLAAAMVFSLGGMTAFAAEEDDAAGQDVATLASDYTLDYSWYNEASTSMTISTPGQLAALSEIVNGTAEGITQDTFKGKTITLGGDIDMNPGATLRVTSTTSGNTVTTTVTADNATSFTPIGNADVAFEGTFYGADKTISNLYVESDTGYLGLFGSVGGTDAVGEAGYGTVENFNLTGVVYSTNSGGDYVGAVCGKLNAGGTIQNIVSSVDVEAPGVYNVGGIVGFAGTPTGDDNNAYGSNPSRDNTKVLCCGNEGTIVHGYNKVGGIVGEVSATVKYCYNNSWVLPRRSGRKSGCGGIAGYNGNNNNADEQSIIAYCYNTGTITNNGRPDGVEGTATFNYLGGIAGWGLGGDGKNEIYNCYNIGDIPAGNTGGYASITAGIEGASEAAIRNNYSLISSSINNYSGASDQEKGIQVSEDDFKSPGNDVGDILTNLGAYFVADTENVNEGYPILFWQAEQSEPTVTDLSIEEGPTKTTYKEGEVFDPTGMVVIATYSNGEKAQIQPAYATYEGTLYTLSDGYEYPTDGLAADAKEVPISYGGITKEQAINGSDTEPSTDSIQILINGQTSELSYDTIDAAIAAADTQTFTYGSTSVTAQFVLIRDLIDLSVYDVCSYTVTSSDGSVFTDMPADAYLYKTDDGEYRTAVNGSAGRYWRDNPTTIEVIAHTWDEEVTWNWSDDNSSAAASRTCTVCDVTETVDAVITTEHTDPAERTAGVDRTIATATFSDGTTATDTKNKFYPATGTIQTVMNRGGDNKTDGTLTYEAINALMDETDPQTFTYRSHNTDNEVPSVFVPITDLLEEDINGENFCCYYVTSDVNGSYEVYLPKTACMYIRDDSLIYRTAVNGSNGNMWVNSPTYIEVRFLHSWGTPEWTWSDDYSSASVTVTCHVDSGYGDEVCGTTDHVEATITSETTEPTATKPGETVYTATATLSDGQVVTDTKSVEIPATEEGSITILIDGVESTPLTYHEINEAIAAAPEQTFHYTSGNGPQELTKQFAQISEMLGIDYDFCSYTVTGSDDFVSEGLPTDTCMYLRDDKWVYRTAVDGGRGSQWVDDPVTIEVLTKHTWSVVWTWADDYSSATAVGTCSACGLEETYEADITSVTQPPTETQDGATVYTATATFSDGQVETDSKTVVLPATGVEPTVQVTVASTLTGGTKTYDGIGVSLTATADVTPDTAEVSYQWYKDDEAIEGATYSLLNIDGNVADSGTYKCVVTATNDDMTAEDSAEITITIEKAVQDISYGATRVTKYDYDEDFINELTEATVFGEITYTSSDESVATVDASSGEVSIHSAGTVTITATAAGSDDYEEATASYILLVNDSSIQWGMDANQEQLTWDADKGEYVYSVTYNGESIELGMVITLDEEEMTDLDEVTYQWYLYNSDTLDYEPIEGAAEPAYTLDGEAVNAGDYLYMCVAVISYKNGDEHTIFGPVEVLIEKDQQEISYEVTSIEKTVGDEPFTNPLTTTMVDTAGGAAITYTSSDETIAAVDETGEVTILTDGEVTITAAASETTNYEGATASYTITIATNKAALQAEYDEDSELSGEDYTPVSWAPFEEALENAKTVLDNENARQAEIDDALEALQSAKANLTEKADKGVLEATIEAAEALNEDDYTPDSWAALEIALEAARGVDADENAAQDAVDEAEINLITAIADLQFAEPQPEEADKTVLLEEYTEGADLSESDYTEASWAPFAQALADAQAVLLDVNATQQEVDAAAEALQTAMDNLEPVPTPEPVPTVNKEVLEASIADAEALNEDDYTAESWAALQTALDAAKAVDADEDATQDAVKQATIDLTAAIAELRPAESQSGGGADKTDLLDEYVEGMELTESDYTPESWAPFAEALADAQAVLVDVNATQEEVEAAEEALKTAMDNLVPVGGGGTYKDGLIKDPDGVWRLYKDNVFREDYTGFAANQYGEWYVEKGVVTFSVTDILKDKSGAIGDAGTWYYVIDSKVQTGFTGLSDFSNQYGWWYIVDGRVDFTRNSVDKNCNGWWYVVGGKVQLGFTGLANYKNEYGWWYIKNGAVDFNHNGVDKNRNGWWYVTGGKVQFGFTGLANYRNDHGWWYIESGRVNFNHTGVEKNKNGWWYVKDSKVDFRYTGIASNRYGTWYIKDGSVQFDYSGTVTFNGKSYIVKGGKV